MFKNKYPPPKGWLWNVTFNNKMKEIEDKRLPNYRKIELATEAADQAEYWRKNGKPAWGGGYEGKHEKGARRGWKYN